MKSSRIDNDFFLFVDRHDNECEFYIARHNENQI